MDPITILTEKFSRLLDTQTINGDTRGFLDLTGKSRRETIALTFLNLAPSSRKALIDAFYRAIPKQRRGNMPYADFAMDLLGSIFEFPSDARSHPKYLMGFHAWGPEDGINPSAITRDFLQFFVTGFALVTLGQWKPGCVPWPKRKG